MDKMTREILKTAENICFHTKNEELKQQLNQALDKIGELDEIVDGVFAILRKNPTEVTRHKPEKQDTTRGGGGYTSPLGKNTQVILGMKLYQCPHPKCKEGRLKRKVGMILPPCPKHGLQFQLCDKK